MHKAMATALLAISLGVSACGNGRDTAETRDTDMMEGGGAYPAPAPTLEVEPLATDPATAAAQNKSENMAPGPLDTTAPGALPGGRDATPTATPPAAPPAP